MVCREERTWGGGRGRWAVVVFWVEEVISLSRNFACWHFPSGPLFRLTDHFPESSTVALLAEGFWESESKHHQPSGSDLMTEKDLGYIN